MTEREEKRKAGARFLSPVVVALACAAVVAVLAGCNGQAPEAAPPEVAAIQPVPEPAPEQPIQPEAAPLQVTPEPAPEQPIQPEAAPVQSEPEPEQEQDEEGYDETAPVRIASLEIPDNFPRLCRRFALLLEARHFLQKPLDADVSRQAWSNYISRLDYDHSIFLQSDIEEFLPWQDRLHLDLKRGDLEFAVTVFERFRQRLRERAAFVNAFLDAEQDFTVDEEYTWKRKDAPWPEDQAAQDDLWRRRLKNELLSRIVARDFAEEKKAKKESEAQRPDAEEAPGSEGSATNTPPAIDMSPDAVVRRRYKQYLGIVADADADYVIERFLCSFTEAYDPHSAYMPPARAEDFNIEMNLTLCGIGATLQSEDGMAKIVKIIPGSPADCDTRDIRLREGDKIFGVGQGDDPVEDIVHLPLDKIVKRIRGKKGTKVVLHVICGSDPSGATTKVVDLIRDDIKLEESAATGRVIRVACNVNATPEGDDAPAPRERSFGYVRLPGFYGTMGNPGDENFRSCTEDVKEIMADFGDDVEGMILDLRGNGGGSLREAVTLAGAFIRMGPIVAVRENRGAQPLIDQDPAIAFRKPLVVMIDRASASASEIVAAALQDYGRAVIVGDTKSHGKGSVQNVIPLIASDESYGTLKITIAAFYRVDGRSTQIDGVSSDIVLPSLLEHMDIGEDKLPNALPASRIPPLGYSLAYPIGSLLSGLREKSAARLADNEEWRKHLKRVAHVREIADRTTLPLCYDKRMALVKADAEFDLDETLDSAFDEALGTNADDEVDEGAEEGDGEESPDAQDHPADADLQAEPEEDDEGDGIDDDVVLREAANILADLCDVQGDKGLSPSQDEDVSDWIFRFFR